MKVRIKSFALVVAVALTVAAAPRGIAGQRPAHPSEIIMVLARMKIPRLALENVSVAEALAFIRSRYESIDYPEPSEHRAPQGYHV